ncbi:glycosyltransferase [Candidatus Margulisiibacteriota bacterium]
MPSSQIKLDKIAIIGSYSPRRCGIATFTHDLTSALKSNLWEQTKIQILAMNDSPRGYAYTDDVHLEILDSRNEDYVKAADFLNTNMVDVVNLQHEFGIFGGNAGKKILHLINNIRMPLTVTLHTVLQNPSAEHRRVFLEIARKADRLIVMTNKALEILTSEYNVPKDKTVIIPHGIPDVSFIDTAFYKDKFGLSGKKVLLTFGLLSPNKGLEIIIKAMPDIIKKHPDTVYIILGSLHPHEKKKTGTSYLNKLQRSIMKLGLEKSVFFIDGFFSLEELCEYIGAADIYVIPYLNKEQITSGTLSYAMGAGKPIVSTPFWHAKEYLADNRGILAEFNDHESFIKHINDLLSDEVKRNAIRKRAYDFTRPMIWKEVAKSYYSLFQTLVYERIVRPKKNFYLLDKRETNIQIPDINLAHLKSLTDDTGILEHAKFSIPDRKHGYCLDDNARALVVSIQYYRLTKDPTIIPYIDRYLSFILDAYDEKRNILRNRLTYKRHWDNKEIPETAHARGLCALGMCCAHGPKHIEQLAIKLFRDSAPKLESTNHPHVMAIAIGALSKYLTCFSGDAYYRKLKNKLASKLYTVFTKNSSPDWPWFEDKISWGSATIAKGLIIAGNELNNNDYLNLGIKLLKWLINAQLENSAYFSFIGNQGWYYRNKEKALFDQQPIEAHSMASACIAAYQATGKKEWITKARLAFNWFLGLNILNIPVYDYMTGGCKDGIQVNWVNENEGAESTLCWLMTLLEYKILLSEDSKHMNLTLF